MFLFDCLKISEIFENKLFFSLKVILSVGGAQEALNSKPGQYKIVVKKRKGFIKLCIVTGASLVPVFSFGEGKMLFIF